MEAWMKTLRTAVRFHQEGELDQAEEHYREVLELEPNQALALHSMGLIAYHRGHYDDAEEFVSQAILADPQAPLQYNTMGVVYEALHKVDQAINAYSEAIKLNNNYAEAYKNLAIAFKIQGRYEDALLNYQQAARSAPESAQILLEYADTLRHLGRLSEATVQYERALSRQSDFAEAKNNLALCLKQQGRFAEAEAAQQQALQEDPENAGYLSNLASIQQEQGKLDKALATCQQLIRKDPNQPVSIYNFACVLRDQGRLEEAIHNNQRVIAMQPEMAEAHWNLAVCLLLAGRYAEGWEKFGWRRQIGYLASYPHLHVQPAWDGSSFTGKRLFIHCEQGLGDAIQLARLLPLVKERGGTVILGAWTPLCNLFQDLPGIDEILELSWEVPPYVDADLVTSLLDLPGLLHIIPNTVDVTEPYLSANPTRVAQWQARLSAPERKIGLIWAGSARHINDRNRSCDIHQLSGLAEIPNLRLYSLQKDLTNLKSIDTLQRLGIENLGDELHDLADTAAVMTNLDLIISVDTAPLHLAAALGRPTWGLLPYSPDWRWQLQREDSDWYPSLRLFRQQQPGDWDDVIARVEAALTE